MQPNIEQRLSDIRKTAKIKGQLERTYLGEKDIILLVARVLPQTSSLILAEALKSDLRSMHLYDAIASWCDQQHGLAAQFPLQILQVANQLMETN